MTGKRVALVALLLVLIAAGIWRLETRRAEHETAKEQTRGAPARPIAVAAASVTQRDVPIDLDGLGSVVAYKTVTVKTQVDGVLQEVFYREGQQVKRGQLLAQIDPRPFLIQLQQAEGNLTRDEALLDGTRRNVERYTKLTGQKYLARQQLDDTRSQFGQYQGDVQVDRAQVASARLNLSYARITAPIDGVTGVRIVDPGNFVRASDATGIVVITQLDPIAVLFTLPQDDLPRIAEHVAGPTPLKVDAFDRDGVTLMGSGELLLIDNQINQTTATIRLKAIFDNPQKKLWPNQFVKARLHVSVERAAVVVPAVAIQRGPQGTFVYAVRSTASGDVAEVRALEVQFSSSELSVVKRGLSPGERVVVEGQDQLKPGALVQVREVRADGAGGTQRSRGGAP